MAYTGKKRSNYIWIPKAKSDLKEYRDGLRLCRDLEDAAGSFNDKTLGNLQVESGAIFNGSLTVGEYRAKYKAQQLGNQSYVSNARMLIRMCRFFGWIYRDAKSKSTYYLTERGRLISQFIGKFPNQIGNLKEFDLFLEDIVTFKFFSVDDQPAYRNKKFKTCPNLQILRFLSQFGYMHHYELAITALSATNISPEGFTAKSDIIESMRYGEINIGKALRELEHDPTNESTLTGIYDGPKVLCSFLRQLGLVETVNTKEIQGASEYYQSAYTEYLIKPPRTVFRITEFGEEIRERYSDIVPIWFDGISGCSHKYTIANILDSIRGEETEVEGTPEVRKALTELQNQSSIPVQISHHENNIIKIAPYKGFPDFRDYRDIPPEERENYKAHQAGLSLFDKTKEKSLVQVQLPIDRTSLPQTSHCFNCYPAPCVSYLAHLSTPNSSDYLAYKVCPTDALVRGDSVSPPIFDETKCINCLLCVDLCPIGSIETSQTDGQVERILMTKIVPDDRELIAIEYGQTTNSLTQYLEHIQNRDLTLSPSQRLSIVRYFEEIISPGKEPRIDQNPFYTWVRNTLRGLGYSAAYTGGAGMKTRSDVTIMAPYPVAIEVKSPEEKMGAKAVRQTVDAASQLYRRFKQRVYTCVIGQYATPEVLKKADEHQDYMLSQGVSQFNIPIIESKLLIYLFLMKDAANLTPEMMEPIFAEFHGRINGDHILELIDRASTLSYLRDQISRDLTALKI